jgi:hypothetical protein
MGASIKHFAGMNRGTATTNHRNTNTSQAMIWNLGTVTIATSLMLKSAPETSLSITCLRSNKVPETPRRSP